MKTISAELSQHIGQEVLSVAMCAKFILTKYQPQILRISNSNPGLIQTLWAHGYADNDMVQIFGVRGMTELNRNFYTVLKVDDFLFQIDVDTTGFNLYEGKGEARKVLGFTEFIHDLTLSF